MTTSVSEFPARRDVTRVPGGGLHPAEPARLVLAALPTPIERLSRLPEAYGIDPETSGPPFVKRDDLTGLEVSGNKVRKLEYLVADALENDADVLVTMGGTQTKHCRATAAVAARLGHRTAWLNTCQESRSPSPPG